MRMVGSQEFSVRFSIIATTALAGPRRTCQAVPAAVHRGGKPLLETGGGGDVRCKHGVLGERTSLNVASHPGIIESNPSPNVVKVQAARQVSSMSQ